MIIEKVMLIRKNIGQIEDGNLNILTGTTSGRSQKIHRDTTTGGHVISRYKYSCSDFH